MNSAVQKKLFEYSEGLFSRAVDVGLWVIVYTGDLALPQQQYGAAWRSAQRADRFLEKINYETLKNAFKTAKRRGFVARDEKQGKKAPLVITQAGKRRLAALVPQYDERRAWDRRFYLVTYDISEKRKRDRDVLRDYLKTIGCGMLQASVWITPYNPKGILREFVAERGLRGSIIVSDIGRDGSIGDERLADLITRVYRLRELNDRYQQWLDVTGQEAVLDGLSAVRYLAILRDDPQLPFVLCPKWWVGDSAYEKIKPNLKKGA